MIIAVSDLGLKSEVRDLLAVSEQPDLVQTVLLPEDQALRHLPALNLAHRRLDFTHPRASLSTLQEVRRHVQGTPFPQTVKMHTAHECVSILILTLNSAVKNGGVIV